MNKVTIRRPVTELRRFALGMATLAFVGAMLAQPAVSQAARVNHAFAWRHATAWRRAVDHGRQHAMVPEPIDPGGV